MIKSLNINNLIIAMERKGFGVNKSDAKNYNLNLVGIRSESKEVKRFPDRFCALWKYKGQWQIRIFTVTLDPGLFFFGDEQMKDSGIDEAILLNGQYKGMFTVGKHRTGELSVIQAGDAKIIRGFNKDKRTEFYNIPYDCLMSSSYFTMPNKAKNWDCINSNGDKVATVQFGKFKLNTFKANVINTPKDAENWVAGGIGWEGNNEHDEFLILCIEAAKQGFEFIDFTMINEEDII